MRASACCKSRAGLASVSVFVALTTATAFAITSQPEQCGDANWNPIGRRLCVLCDHRVLRKVADDAVMVFQVVGVLALGMGKVLRPGVWSRGCGRAVVGAQVGLGFAGLVCAGNYSAFALFAGATLVTLFLASLGEDANEAAHSTQPAAGRESRGHEKVAATRLHSTI